MELPFTIDKLVEIPWNEMIVYTISDSEKKQLMDHKGFTKKRYNFPRGNVWDKHSHDEPQLLLVIEGELIHQANNREYKQLPNDLLIVPANIVHAAYAGDHTDLVVYAFNKI